MHLDTPRTRLRIWRNADREAFFAMNTDPEVMADLGGPLTRAQSDAKMDRYAGAFAKLRIGRWLVEDRNGAYLGYAGIMPVEGNHPLGAHYEIGWRLVRCAWGKGLASEAAKAALSDAFDRAGLTEVLAYTSPENLRSQAVMNRLGLARDPQRDFIANYDAMKSWRGLVWVASPN